MMQSFIHSSSILITFLVASFSLSAQVPVQWELQNTRTQASIRGISAVDHQVAWFAANQGTVGRTLDGGKTWELLKVPGADSANFRDIEAFSALDAVLMSVGEGAQSNLYKTKDGGKTWKLVLANPHEKGFFDGIAFWDQKNGILAGDPIGDKLFIALTQDGGETWQPLDLDQCPRVQADEYAFAASGTHVCVQGKKNVWLGTGGSAARVFYSKNQGKTWQVANTPILQSAPSKGVFSVAFKNKHWGIAVGGDYTEEDEQKKNVILSQNGGKNWSLVDAPQVGFRSCIGFTSKCLIAVGQSASSISYDQGKTWTSWGEQGFHTLSVAKDETVWAAGSSGRVAKLKSK